VTLAVDCLADNADSGVAPKQAMIKCISATESTAVLDELIELLRDSLEHGASVGFVPPLSTETARQYWLETIEELGTSDRVMLVARDHNRIVGSVQLSLVTKQNGLHRAEVQKLLVHSSARGRGIGSELMRQVEQVARDLNRTLLVLDTEQGSVAERLYERVGYQKCGTIPKFALSADGAMITTVVFYRLLESDK
jgi:acetyltransferase